ncbi:MFS transporter [Balneolales bacterium ANBcel1]|nr:MFS transporter [Balneolales bacterium ANBcel1]
MPEQSGALEKAYEILTIDDERACRSIPDSACREVPGNFFLNTGNGALTKLAEQIASPSLVLPWLLGAMGAPSALAGFLVPLSRSGSLLPQLLVSSRIRRYARRKYFWVAAGYVQALALLLMIPLALLVGGLWGGIGVLLLLAIFSMASGVASVSFKDVMAKTIPKGKRGTLLSIRATAGGVLALGAGAWLMMAGGDDEPLWFYGALLAGAAMLWIVATTLFALIKEYPGATDGGRNAIAEAKKGWFLLREQPGFRNFVIARSLLLGVPLVVPFYSLFARDLGTGLSGLGLFVMANSLAMVLSSYFWGRLADRSSRHAMAFGGLIGAFAAFIVLVLGSAMGQGYTAWWLSAVIFITGFAQAGTRLGRKTYLVDAAPEDERPLYVAVSNTLVGILFLSSSVIGTFSGIIGVRGVIFMFALMMVAGSFFALRLPDSGSMVAESKS